MTFFFSEHGTSYILAVKGARFSIHFHVPDAKHTLNMPQIMEDIRDNIRVILGSLL